MWENIFCLAGTLQNWWKQSLVFLAQRVKERSEGSEAQVCPSFSGNRTGQRVPGDHHLHGDPQLLRTRIRTVCGNFVSFPSWLEYLLANSYLHKTASSTRNCSYLGIWGCHFPDICCLPWACQNHVKVFLYFPICSDMYRDHSWDGPGHG